MENEKKKTPGASNRYGTFSTMRKLESKAQTNRNNKADISDLKKKASVSKKPSMDAGRLKEMSDAKKDLSYIAGQGGKLANLSAGEQRTYMRGSRAESAQLAPEVRKERSKKAALGAAVQRLKGRAQAAPKDKVKKK